MSWVKHISMEGQHCMLTSSHGMVTLWGCELMPLFLRSSQTSWCRA